MAEQMRTDHPVMELLMDLLLQDPTLGGEFGIAELVNLTPTRLYDTHV